MKNKGFRLPKAFTAKWLKALRSGDYEQGKSALYNDNKYCCLGVAGAICGYQEKLDSSEGEACYLDEINVEDVPEELTIACGLDNFVWVLSRMNDDGKSFEEISEWIEKNVELY